MPKKSNVTSADIEWLRSNHDNLPYTTMARQLDVCVDTLKRILAREGIRYFDAAKYEPAPKLALQMWDRPCTECRAKERRPKWQYFCTRCQRRYGLSREE